MKKLWIFVLAIAALGLSCQSESNENNNNDQTEHTEDHQNHEDHADANAEKNNDAQISEVLSVADFMAKYQASEGAQLLDVRTAEEVAQGSVEGATNIDFYADDFKDQISKLDKEKPLFVYCKSGGRSGQTAELCKELGFKEVYDMEGGYTAYSAE
jgi:phage shock protein E